MPDEFDPFSYGQLTQKVNQLEDKVDALTASVTELVSLANKSKGGLWAGMMIVSAISGAISFISGWYLHTK